jgi:hypothetical protein
MSSVPVSGGRLMMIRSGGIAGLDPFSRKAFPEKGNMSRIIPAAMIHRYAVRFAIFLSLKYGCVDICHFR